MTTKIRICYSTFSHISRFFMTSFQYFYDCSSRSRAWTQPHTKFQMKNTLLVIKVVWFIRIVGPQNLKLGSDLIRFTLAQPIKFIYLTTNRRTHFPFNTWEPIKLYSGSIAQLNCISILSFNRSIKKKVGNFRVIWLRWEVNWMSRRVFIPYRMITKKMNVSKKTQNRCAKHRTYILFSHR